MATMNTPGNRNSTPVENSGSMLRPPTSRQIGAGHHLRASADMGAFSAPLSARGMRPASEVIFNQSQVGHGQGNGDEMDKATQQWLADIDEYESTLEEMATATLDQDFKDELSAIEQWFRVLSESERTSALYALLQQATQMQIRFFIQVLQEMAKNHPMSGILSPANFAPKGSRNSMGGIGRPPPSPGAKRLSQLDPAVINQMFPDAAAAIAKEREKFTQQTGMAPSTRNSIIGDRTSYIAPTISAPDEQKGNMPQPPASPFAQRGSESQQPPIARPKSSSGQPPMGQFTQPPPSAGLRSPRPMGLGGDGNIQSTTLNAPDAMSNGLPMLTPIGNWASAVNTPMVGNFPHQSANQADQVANATAMKLAALSTVNNRIQFDDVRKYRRARSSEGNGGPNSPGMPAANFIMTNEHGQMLTPQQAAALQAQQLAALNGRRSRPNSPGLMVPGMGAMAMPGMQNNGFLTAYDQNAALLQGMTALNLSQFAGMGGGHEGYLSDHGDMQRGRSPRGRRGSSKPPEDPTDPSLLQDIPAWLRSLRLHKYTDNLKDLSWKELVELDDDGLEKRGVNALGARRKMLKVFEQVKEAQGEGKV